MLVWAEIAEGVGGNHHHAERVGFFEELRQMRHEVEAAAAEEGLARDGRSPPHSQWSRLPHHVEAFLSGQRRRTGLARPRSAVDAFEVARQRDLPYGVDRMAACPVVLGWVSVRQL